MDQEKTLRKIISLAEQLIKEEKKTVINLDKIETTKVKVHMSRLHHWIYLTLLVAQINTYNNFQIWGKAGMRKEALATDTIRMSGMYAFPTIKNAISEMSGHGIILSTRQKPTAYTIPIKKEQAIAKLKETCKILNTEVEGEVIEKFQALIGKKK